MNQICSKRLALSYKYLRWQWIHYRERELCHFILSSLFQHYLTLQEKIFLYTFSGEIKTDNLTFSNSEINIFNFIVSKMGFSWNSLV